MQCRIGYIVSRFPKISETFILDEILDLKRRGLEIEIFSLLKEQESKVHHDAAALMPNVHYAAWRSKDFWAAQFHWLSQKPSLYFRSWWKAVRGNLCSLTFLLRALFIVPAAAYFALLLKERKIDRVHAHWATHPALAAYIIHQLTGIRYSVTAHAHDIYVNKSMLKEKLSSSDFIVTISQYNATLLTEYASELAGKIHVIHCGIDPEVFTPAAISPDRGNPFTILCIASLNDYKGHRFLIDACANLKQHGITFRCLLAGEGPERRSIEAQISRLGLQGYVELLGWQKREEIYRLMRQANVMVLPSIVTENGKQEGIPVALMEAMAMEVPVVATTISGLAELVDHGTNGLLVPEKNSGALAAALYLIFKERDASVEMAKAGRAKVLTDFNLHLNAGRLYRLFTGLEQKSPVSTFHADVEFWNKERGTAC